MKWVIYALLTFSPTRSSKVSAELALSEVSSLASWTLERYFHFHLRKVNYVRLTQSTSTEEVWEGLTVTGRKLQNLLWGRQKQIGKLKSSQVQTNYGMGKNKEQQCSRQSFTEQFTVFSSFHWKKDVSADNCFVESSAPCREPCILYSVSISPIKKFCFCLRDKTLKK